MKPAVRFFVVVAILLVTFGLPVLLQQVITPNTAKSITTPTPIVSEVIAKDDIRFLSVPPVLVSANSTFMYKMVVASISGDQLSIEVLSKPEWVQWDTATQQLSGKVPTNSGVFSVAMRAKTADGASAEQSFTVTIDEPEVKGASTVGLWKDPFHPNLADVLKASETNLPALLDEPAVLGETTAVQAAAVGLAGTQKLTEYGLWGLVVILVIITTLTYLKIAKSNVTKKQRASGVVVERGSR